MPTVWKFRGFRVAIYPNDHRPAHVHVIGADCEAIFNLHSPHGPVELRETYGCLPAILRRIRHELTDHLTELCKAWERIHGSV
jgi:Domain of unknown function (DUF4160)